MSIKDKVSDIKVFLVSDGGSTKARVSFKLADVMYITGLKVVQGPKGLFIGMSSYKKKTGEYQDIYFPASKEIRDELTDVILEAYEQKLEA